MASIVLAPLGTVTLAPTAVILPPLITTVPLAMAASMTDVAALPSKGLSARFGLSAWDGPRFARWLVEELESGLGITMGGTTLDGRLTLETVYCLGNCALSPAVMLDGELHGRVDASGAAELLRRAGR